MKDETKAQPFDKSDWELFMGCEEFLGGADPVVRYFDSGSIAIIDGAGLTLHVWMSDLKLQEFVAESGEFRMLTQSRAIEILNAMKL